ncbi:hypothetical protein C8J56DRAFT_1062687 [Mycena floridula]|nr:hypothetical protein C8J56DRAFT_1062687 [Mycena floridula]
MVAPSKLANSNNKELFRAFFMHEIAEHCFTSIYDHSNWGSEVSFQVIVPGLLARFYSSNSRGVVIPRDLLVLFRQYCRKIHGTGHFNPRDGPIGYDYFANILIHCDAVSVALNMTEKREKLLNDMLEKSRRDVPRRKKPPPPKIANEKMSNGKGKSPISQQTDKPIHKSNPASPVTKAQTAGKTLNPKARNLALPLPKSLDLLDNPSPFNRDNENSGSGSGPQLTDDDDYHTVKLMDWSDEDWKEYVILHAERIKHANELGLDEYLAGEEPEAPQNRRRVRVTWTWTIESRIARLGGHM